jgi:hypothetical protein
MNIRKGAIEDMSAVLELIKELATFEKEPNAVVVSVSDLERDGFEKTHYFIHLLRNKIMKLWEWHCIIIAILLGKDARFTWKT